MALAGSFNLVIVEDNPTDARLASEILRDIPALALSIVTDGSELLAFCRKEGAYKGSPTPHLVLLDFVLPKLDGLQTLTALKGDPDLRHIPVVMVSGHADPQVVLECYRAGANAYLLKPFLLDTFSQRLQNTVLYWKGVVTAPGYVPAS